MKIAICEDNNEQRLALKSAVSAVIVKEHIDAEVISFGSEGEFEEYLSHNPAPQICFLDIYLDEASETAGGVELAKIIKGKDSHAAIIFVTSSPEHMLEAWDIGAVHYLIKPITEEKAAVALSRAARVISEEERFIELLVNRRQRKIGLSEILYAESFNKHCNIYTKSGEELKVYMRLDDIDAMLSEQFLRCHHSFIVNMDRIKSISDDQSSFILTNNVNVPIRSRSRNQIISQYETYRFDKMRRES